MSHGFRCSRFPLVLLAALMGGSAGAFAADDDEIVEGPIALENQLPIQQFGPNDFDQWVFQPSGNAKQAQQRMEAQVELQLAELDLACKLTEEQRQTLELAARGDLQRFRDEVEVARKKFNAAKNNPNGMNQIWQDIQPLQLRLTRGLTGPGSLLAKVIPTTLTPEQTIQYDAVTGERQRFRYRASVGVALHMLESGVPLKHEQRQAIEKLLLALPPPRVVGTYEHYLVMYRLSLLGPEKVQPLLDARQWTAMKRQVDQYRGMRQMLIQQGLLTREEIAEPILARQKP